MKEFNPTAELIRQLQINAANDKKAAEALRMIQENRARPTLVPIVDTRVATGSETIKFFKEDDSKENGIRNLEKARLEADTMLLPYALQFLGAYDATNAFDNAKMKSTSFQSLRSLNGGMGLENGRLTVRVNESPFMNEMNLNILHSETGSTTPRGLIYMPSTELIQGSQRVKAEYEAPYTIPANTALKLIIWSIGLVPKSN